MIDLQCRRSFYVVLFLNSWCSNLRSELAYSTVRYFIDLLQNIDEVNERINAAQFTACDEGLSDCRYASSDFRPTEQLVLASHRDRSNPALFVIDIDALANGVFPGEACKRFGFATWASLVRHLALIPAWRNAIAAATRTDLVEVKSPPAVTPPTRRAVVTSATGGVTVLAVPPAIQSPQRIRAKPILSSTEVNP